LPALTKKDIKDPTFAIENKVDYNLSFVRTPEDLMLFETEFQTF
jgi:pyruvate kinase